MFLVPVHDPLTCCLLQPFTAAQSLKSILLLLLCSIPPPPLCLSFVCLFSPPLIHLSMCLWAPACRTCRTAGSGCQSPVTGGRRPSSAGGRGTSLYPWLQEKKTHKNLLVLDMCASNIGAVSQCHHQVEMKLNVM